MKPPLYCCEFVNSSPHKAYLESRSTSNSYLPDHSLVSCNIIWLDDLWRSILTQSILILWFFHLSVSSPHPHWLICGSFLEFHPSFQYCKFGSSDLILQRYVFFFMLTGWNLYHQIFQEEVVSFGAYCAYKGYAVIFSVNVPSRKSRCLENLLKTSARGTNMGKINLTLHSNKLSQNTFV